jgi:hypothetical protein
MSDVNKITPLNGADLPTGKEVKGVYNLDNFIIIPAVWEDIPGLTPPQ